MKKAVRIVCALLILSFAFLCSTGFKQQQGELYPHVVEFGQEWLKEHYDDNTVIEEIVPVQTNDEISAFCIDFSLNGEPNGYVMVDADPTVKNPVIEFSEHGNSIYNTLVEQAQNNGFQSENLYLRSPNKKRIFSSGPFQYGVSVQKNGQKYISEQSGLSFSYNDYYTKYKINPTSTPSDNNFYNGIRYNTNNNSGIKYNNYLNNSLTFTPFLQTRFAQVPNEGNCGPTAMTNLVFLFSHMGYSNLSQYTPDEVYNKICTYCGYRPDRIRDTPMLVSAASQYVQEQGYKCWSMFYWWQSWGFYTNDINNGHAVVTYIASNSTAHLVVAFGYREYNDGGKFLRVMDGWYASMDRFLQYDGYYKTVSGCKWKII